MNNFTITWTKRDGGTGGPEPCETAAEVIREVELLRRAGMVHIQVRMYDPAGHQFLVSDEDLQKLALPE